MYCGCSFFYNHVIVHQTKLREPALFLALLDRYLVQLCGISDLSKGTHILGVQNEIFMSTKKSKKTHNLLVCAILRQTMLRQRLNNLFCDKNIGLVEIAGNIQAGW